jgi:hydrogenase-4 membrane subunit HyfE
MGLALTATASVALWLILWATGLKSFDGFLIALGIVTVAATIKMVVPYLLNREE